MSQTRRVASLRSVQPRSPKVETKSAKRESTTKYATTINELADRNRTLALYFEDWLALYKYYVDNATGTEVLVASNGYSVSMADLRKLYRRLCDELETIASHMVTVKKRSGSGRKKTNTYYFVSETLVDFLYGSNLGNGFAMAFAEKLKSKQRVNTATPEQVAAFERAAEYARLDGGSLVSGDAELKRAHDEVARVFRQNAQQYERQYEENLREVYKAKSDQMPPLDQKFISVKDNLSLLFESKISAAAHLLRLWYLYIRVNKLSSPNEGVRFSINTDSRLRALLNKPYEWLYYDAAEKDTVDYMGNSSKDGVSNGKGVSKSDARNGARVDTIGDRRRSLAGKNIIDHMRDTSNIYDKYGNLDPRYAGMMDISKGLVDEDGNPLKDESGGKVRNTSKFKKTVDEDGVLLSYVMTFINNWIIPDAYIPQEELAVLSDEATADAFNAQHEYLGIVLEGVKLADSYFAKLADYDKKQAEGKRPTSPKKKTVSQPVRLYDTRDKF